jgi:hypothetical protein
MIRLTSITSDPDQIHTVDFLADLVSIRIRFIETLQYWYMDVNYKGVDVKGIRVAAGVRLLKSNNFPFDIVVSDESENGLDPFRLEDMQQRMGIYIAEPDEIASVRGYVVEL